MFGNEMEGELVLIELNFGFPLLMNYEVIAVFLCISAWKVIGTLPLYLWCLCICRITSDF